MSTRLEEGHDTSVPSRAAVAAQLQRITTHPLFEQAPVLARLLRHLAQRTLAGELRELKEYALGIELFGRRESFDPRSDNIVRANVRRLRQRLDSYYRGDGRGDPLLFELPRGHYVVHFRARDPCGTTSDTDLADSTGRRHRIAVLPFANRSDDSAHVTLAHGLTEQIIARLVPFRAISVVPASAATSADFLVEGSIHLAGRQLRVFVRLTALARRELIWSQSYDRVLGPATILELQDEIAERIGSTIADSYGVVRTIELAQARQHPSETISTDQAVLLAQAATREGFPDAAVDRALAALKLATQREPNCADAWAWLGAMYRSRRPRDLGHAEAAARRALELDPTNQQGLIDLFTVHFLRGEHDAFHEIVDRAISLNPGSADLHLAVGAYMALAGSDEALMHATRAIDLHPDPPPLMFYAPALHHYRKGEDQLAIDAAHRGLARLTAPGNTGLERVLRVTLAAAFGQLGHRAQAAGQLVILRENHAWEITDMIPMFEDLNACAKLVSRLEDGLCKAVR